MGNRIITTVYLLIFFMAAYELIRRLRVPDAPSPAFPILIAVFCLVRIYLIYRNEQSKQPTPKNKTRGK